jgi:hypothetical protein
MNWNFNRGVALGSQKQRDIEAEYDEPFVDVLTGYAAMGYGIDTTARVLGYHASTFRALLKRRAGDWVIKWPALVDQVIMKDRVPFTDERRAKISRAAVLREARRRAERGGDARVEGDRGAGGEQGCPGAGHPWRR